MIFITSKVLNLVHSTRNRLRPVNYFFGILSVQIHIKGSVTSIRYCSIFKVLPVCFSADSLFILPQTRELVKHFFRGFSAALFGFVGRSVERSNIILHPQGFVNPFLTKICILFCAPFTVPKSKGRVLSLPGPYFSWNRANRMTDDRLPLFCGHFPRIGQIDLVVHPPFGKIVGVSLFLLLEVAPDLELVPRVLLFLHHDVFVVEIEVHRQAQVGVAGHAQQLVHPLFLVGHIE